MAEQQLTEEQRKELEEKIRKMSPEELAEFQRQQCIFCQIIAGKIPSQKVYENEEMMAILDINPASKGHLLLMPREHYAIMPQIPDQMVGRLMVMAKKLSQALLKGLKVEGTNVFVANGLAAGQRSQHFIIHIIPRREGDGIMALQEKFISKEMQQKVVMSIVNILNNLMGVKKEVIGVEEKKDQRHNNNNKSEDNQSGKDIDDTFPKTAIRKDDSENIEKENIENIKEESDDLGTYQQEKHIKLKKGSEKKNQKEHVHSILPVEAVQGTKTKRVRRGSSLTGRQRSSMDDARASKMLCTYNEQKQEKQKNSAEEKQQKAKKRKTEGKGSNREESKDEGISLDQIAEMFR